MFGNLRGWEWIIILVIVLLIFGAPRLPGLARSLGKSMRILKDETKAMRDGKDADDEADGDDSGERG